MASAFCLGAGYSTVNLTTPTSSSTLGSGTAGLAVIGPQSFSNTATTVFTSGATNTRISGAFYFPNGAVSMSGGATLHDTVDASTCLMLVASQVTLSRWERGGDHLHRLGRQQFRHDDRFGAMIRLSQAGRFGFASCLF
jgi:hypothetical protein